MSNSQIQADLKKKKILAADFFEISLIFFFKKPEKHHNLVNFHSPIIAIFLKNQGHWQKRITCPTRTKKNRHKKTCF